MHSNVTQSCSAQDRIDHGVNHDIRIGMAFQSQGILDALSSQDKSPPWNQPVTIETLTYSQRVFSRVVLCSTLIHNVYFVKKALCEIFVKLHGACTAYALSG
jgi:hypothetical protein